MWSGDHTRFEYSHSLSQHAGTNSQASVSSSVAMVTAAVFSLSVEEIRVATVAANRIYKYMSICCMPTAHWICVLYDNTQIICPFSSNLLWCETLSLSVWVSIWQIQLTLGLHGPYVQCFVTVTDWIRMCKPYRCLVVSHFSKEWFLPWFLV